MIMKRQSYSLSSLKRVGTRTPDKDKQSKSQLLKHVSFDDKQEEEEEDNNVFKPTFNKSFTEDNF